MKHGKPLFILLTALLALQAVMLPASAEYTGPNSGARRYSYEVEVAGTCTEEYSCCTWWSDEPCGSNPWDIGCCMAYGTCTRDYDCTKTETVSANHPDATITTSSSCSTGFGANNWCKGDVTVNLTGKDEWKGINGFESSDGHHLSKGGGHTETGSVSFSGEQNRSVDFWALSTLGDTSTKSSVAIRIDKTSPESVGIRVEGTKGPGNAYRGKVTFVGTASDSMAGVKSIYVDLGLGDGEKTGSASASANYSGVITPCVRAVDNAGNFKVYQLPDLGVHTKYSKKGVTSLYRISQLFDVVKKWDDFMRKNYSVQNYWYPRLDRNKKIKPGEPIKGDVNRSYADTRNVSSVFYKNLEKLCQMAGVEYKSAHALRYGHINYGMKHAKTIQDFKAISLNVMHGSIDITDKIYSRMNIDAVNETISNMGYEENIHTADTEKRNNDIPVSELLASLPVEIREKIVREKLGLS